MAGSSLLALIDDIATLLDDISVMTKVAAQKTAGVLGDDLALNAQQVTGVSADRELPVVWAVAKGSFFNKLILVPLAILISVFIPWAITPLLMVGGAYLCFEGAEKLLHKFFHKAEQGEAEHQAALSALLDSKVDMVSFERNKVKGAIRTDFVLSAEIIAITLGTVAEADLISQFLVLSIIAIVMTVGVYGLVGGLVKVDDLGLYLFQKPQAGAFTKKFGQALLSSAPVMMKFLSIAGTIAMFLVGGGILVHGVPAVHHLFEHWTERLPILLIVLNGLTGIIAGTALVLAFKAVEKIRQK
jgi:predicted DNA repair protein MutK